MDHHNLAQIAAASFGGAIGLELLDRYRRWKHGRSELVISKDWRGRPVVDRKLKLFERLFVTSAILFFSFCIVFGVYTLWPQGRAL